eukprot:TRINITY_DN32452_c0_g1_i1.p1 TRINITY_DN32452_c0_g1~~TRINITY_DN32452_c0_g1_i1.p1  ORF type:complete len:323 (-),score=65.85 TRINITY_DN32452_c0_g1_i1:210-1178(-)
MAVQVRFHEGSESFMASCGELLLSQIALNQHLLANANAVPAAEDSRLLLSVHGMHGQVLGAVVVAQVHNFVAATVGGEITPEAAELVLVEARKRSAALLDRVSMSMGGAASRQAFAAAFLRMYPGVTATPGLSTAAMELRGECPKAAAHGSGVLRQVCSGLATPAPDAAEALTTDSKECTSAVLDILASWNREFCRDALSAVQNPPSIEESRKTILEKVAKGDLYVWEDEDNGLVAMAAVGRRLQDVGVSLSLVYTPPEHRGHGYAAQLLSSMGTLIARQRKRVFLLADAKSEFGTVRLYEKIGFSNEGEYGDIRFSRTASE